MKTLASLSLSLFLLSSFAIPSSEAARFCPTKASTQSIRCKKIQATVNAKEETQIGTAYASERSGFGRFE